MDNTVCSGWYVCSPHSRGSEIACNSICCIAQLMMFIWCGWYCGLWQFLFPVIVPKNVSLCSKFCTIFDCVCHPSHSTFFIHHFNILWYTIWDWSCDFGVFPLVALLYLFINYLLTFFYFYYYCHVAPPGCHQLGLPGLTRTCCLHLGRSAGGR